MHAGGCSWQWLQHTLHQPAEPESLLQRRKSSQAPHSQLSSSAPPALQSPSLSRASIIHTQHVKHARRLLRLFRYALSKVPQQSHFTSSGETLSEEPAPDWSEAHTMHQTRTPAVAGPDSTLSSPVPASASAAQAIHAPHSASTQPLSELTSASSAAADQASASDCPTHSDRRISQPVRATSDGETTIVVEAVVPDKLLPVNLCRTPCLFNFSLPPEALSDAAYADANPGLLKGADSQSKCAEEEVRRHLQSTAGSHIDGAPLQLSSSFKVKVFP